MSGAKVPATPAIRVLKAHQVDFEVYPYRYQDKGGTAVAAQQLGVDEDRVIKTLVMETEAQAPFLILMHGDREVSAKALARVLEAKTVSPCHAAAAHRHTGYQVGGISPFGTRKALPVYVEASILALPEIFINGGKRGVLLKMTPGELHRVLHPVAVTVARAR